MLIHFFIIIFLSYIHLADTEEVKVKVTPQSIIQSAGSSALFTCDVHFDGIIVIDWTFNHGPLPLNAEPIKTSVESRSLLYITDISRRNIGYYICSVRSGLGITRAVATLEVPCELFP